MKIFVTGLCLQGNKGGPAIALSLMNQLEIAMAEEKVEFIFSIPSGNEFEPEKKWSDYYGVSIVEDFRLKPLLSLSRPNYFVNGWKRMRKWLEVAKKCDLILEMSAISYVGPPIGSIKQILNYRFRYYLCAKFFGKPFLAWTQSYGPFSNFLVKALAKTDLSRQPIIFCRGKDCLDEVTQLLPNAKARSFPDVAVTLEYDSDFGSKYLTEIVDIPSPEKLVTISPSAVIYSKTKYKGDSNSHAVEISEFCKYLIAKGYVPLLVPHTYRANQSTPENCDYAVSLIIRDLLSRNGIPISIVEEDLSPLELKSIISCAHIHVGARYHSVVAALSSGVPAISLSWHSKYLDLMRLYSLDSFVYDGIGEAGDIEKLQRMFECMVDGYEHIREKVTDSNEGQISKVEENSQIFSALIKESLFV